MLSKKGYRYRHGSAGAGVLAIGSELNYRDSWIGHSYSPRCHGLVKGGYLTGREEKILSITGQITGGRSSHCKSGKTEVVFGCQYFGPNWKNGQWWFFLGLVFHSVHSSSRVCAGFVFYIGGYWVMQGWPAQGSDMEMEKIFTCCEVVEGSQLIK